MATVLVPAVTVEFAPDKSTGSISAAYDDLAWQDITSYVLAADGLRFSRGQSDPSATTPTAGQLTVTLNNSDGRFTPGRDDGPYGQITTKCALRVTGYTALSGTGSGPFGTEYDPAYYDAVASVSYPMWTGFLTDVDWEMSNGQPIVRFTASDIIATAARSTTQPWMSSRMRALSSGIAGYWPLTDGVNGPEAVTYGAAVASGLAGGAAAAAYPETGSTVTRGVTSDLSPDAVETVFAFTPDTGAAYVAANLAVPAAGDIAVSVWVRPTTLPAGVTHAQWTTGATTTTYLGVEVDATGKVLVTEDGITGTYGSSGDVAAATWTHLYVEKDHSVTGSFASRFRVWVNGSELSKTSGGASVSADTRTTMRLNFGVGPTLPDDSLNGQIGHAAVWTTLDSTRVAYLVDNGTTQPTAAARFTDLARVTALPDVLPTWMVADSSADTAVTAQATGSKTLLELVAQLAVAARGDVRVTAEGKLRLASQTSCVAPVDAAVTLSAAADVLTLDGAFGIDDVQAVGSATVTRQPSGESVTVTRTVNPSVESTAIDLYAVDANVAQSLAYATANTDPDIPKAPTLTLSMEWLTHVGLADAVLGLDVGDRITVTDLPAAAPATSLSLVVSNIAHEITAAAWLVTVSTATPTAGLVLNDSDRGQLNDELLGV